jgi:hypothetical protein
MQAELREQSSTEEFPTPNHWLRRRLLLLFAVLMFSYAYFYQGGGWNQNSRFDLLRAILDQHTLRIDAYHSNTEDKALFNGRFYSDKAPGQVLLALPLVAISRPALRAIGVDPHSANGLIAQSYVATLFSSSLPMALAACTLYWLASSVGFPRGAAFAAVSLGVATPLWAYSTLLLGRTLAGACLLFSFAAAVSLHTTRTREVAWGLAVGLAAGWATVTEYPAAPAAAVLALFALTQVWPRGPAARWRTVLGITLGASFCVLVLMAYQYAAFGSPFQLGYSHYESGAFPWMHRGFLGLTYPKPLILFKLLFGGHLGLFLLAPVLLAAPFGLRQLAQNEYMRPIAIAAAAIPLYYWLFNGSFSGWHGGNSYGPRYMLAGIPALCVGLAPVYAGATKRLRWLLLSLTGVGIALTLMAEATTVQPPQMMRVPVVQLIWPAFWSGHFSLNQTSMLVVTDDPTGRLHGAFNLGELAGLHGLASIVPLLIVWALAALVWIRLDRNARSRTARS